MFLPSSPSVTRLPFVSRVAAQCRSSVGLAALALSASAVAPMLTAPVVAQRAPRVSRSAPATPAITSLSDAEFWKVFTSFSEPGGRFASENFVSNEMTFQHVIPALQNTVTKGGVYLGVGPEQNFTYIANLEPQLGVLFDIRRQAAMQHLMYKALFEQSPTRAAFVAKLFSRPAVAELGADASVHDLFAAADSAQPDEAAYRANRAAIVKTLTVDHGFAVAPEDLQSIEYVYEVFYRAGPGVNYGYRPNNPSFIQSRYPNYGALQTATNADSVPMAFLGSEALYRRVRDMHLHNLIVPVVGDFAGPTAIRSVADFLKKRKLTVTTFYVSNVEQYLFQQAGASDRFYANVAALPLDNTSRFVRSVPPVGMLLTTMPRVPGSLFQNGPPNGTTVVTIMDSAGLRIMRTTRDSAGVPVTQTVVDSSYLMLVRAADSIVTRGLLVARPTGPVVTGSLLTSGLASMRLTLDAFLAGRLREYQDVIDMTQTSGWK